MAYPKAGKLGTDLNNETNRLEGRHCASVRSDHTHASILLKAGVPVKVVSERLGHSSPAFTMTVYQHARPGMQADAAAMFSETVFGQRAIGDVLADSGYAYRVPERWATPLRRIGGRLVQDPASQRPGPQRHPRRSSGRQREPVVPATPGPPLEIGPLGRARRPRRPRPTTDLWRSWATTSSAVSAPTMSPRGLSGCRGQTALRTQGRLDGTESRTPRGAHPTDGRSAPLLRPGQHHRSPVGQRQDPPETRLPRPAFRRSYRRRTGAKSSFSTLKDPATTDIRRGWCRMLGRTRNLVVLACATVVRNLRVLASFERRQAEDARRAAAGQAPRIRKRRRQSPPG